MLKLTALLLVVAVVFAGCSYQLNLLNKKQPLAMETTLKRAQFEMECPQATGDVLSRTVAWIYYDGCGYGYGYYSSPYYGYGRAVYTIGVTGCGKAKTYVTTCTDGSIGCFAEPGQSYSARMLTQLTK